MQTDARLRAVYWEDRDLVSATETGRPTDGNNLRTRSFAALLRKACLPPMRFHSLRHAAPTLVMAEGLPVKVIGDILGHADVTATQKVYSHLLPSMQEQAAEAMDRLFANVR